MLRHSCTVLALFAAGALLWRLARPRSCVTVYSHHGLTEPPHPLITSEWSVLKAMREGVRAFDVDLFWTADGVVHVGHPVALRDGVLGGEAPWDVTSSALLTRCLRSPHAPAASALEAAQTALHCQQLRAVRFLEIAQAHARNLTIALDLKGNDRPDYRAKLVWLHGEICRRRLQRTVWLWVESAGSARVLREREAVAAFALARIGKPLRDAAAPRNAAGEPLCAAQIDPADAAVFSFLGPSAACANSQLLDAAAARPWASRIDGWLVWVTDSTDTVPGQWTAGVNNIISNRPLRLTREVRRRVRLCSSEAVFVA